jgi:hypothetical protein
MDGTGSSQQDEGRPARRHRSPDPQETDMTDSSQQPTYESAAPLPPLSRGQTGWTGWIVFAGTMLVMLGIFHIIEGLVAVLRDEVFLVGPGGLAVNVDYTAWGWIHIVGGALIILVGGCLLAGQTWARVVTVIVAALSAVANMAFLPALPVWSAILIALDVLIIWAVTVHGSEVK